MIFGLFDRIQASFHRSQSRAVRLQGQSKISFHQVSSHIHKSTTRLMVVAYSPLLHPVTTGCGMLWQGREGKTIG
jgi:hypothetical protein